MNDKDKAIRVVSIILIAAPLLAYLIADLVEMSSDSSAAAERSYAAAATWFLLIILSLISSIVLAAFSLINKSKIQSRSLKWGLAPLALLIIYFLVLILPTLIKDWNTHQRLVIHTDW